MRNRKLLLSVLILIAGFSLSYGQCECSNKQMIVKIDSIAKARKIIQAKVYFNEVTNRFNLTATESRTLTDKDVFTFEGNFLVVDDHYFNLNKLLYFEVAVDHLAFFFQGY